MQSHHPLVSVIIPAYNAEKFISKTLQSVLSQTYINIEVLVVDDGSLDRTTEIVESFARNDNRVILIKQSNKGVAAARNLAISKSTGEYIAPVDADDIWYPKKLEKQVECFLNADSSVGVVYAWSAIIDEDDAIIGEYNYWSYLNMNSVEGDVYKEILFRNFLGNASVPLIRRVCFETIGGYNSELKQNNAQGCEDLDIYLRLAEHYKFCVVQEFLIGYRQVNGSMSRSYTIMEKSHNLVMQSARQRHPEIASYIFNWSDSYFQYYLALRAFKAEDFGNTILYLYRAVKFDAVFLFNPDLYELISKIVMKQLLKTVIGGKYRDLLKFKQELEFNKNPITDITQIKLKEEKPKFWHIYNNVVFRRCKNN
ncbi:glycosyltransferase family 2 protein [Nostoc sp. UHCC 0870]|uniref:glycosyltransferase family 2 protein n=1 Tax=Nostoc sp. UHCC 0870 TaxID=2914041 RepID=UPI001EDFEF71|nr:glycosyltransferase family 2 protein [Nostoc sp. UHCC 0870]UKO97248.1 glycosyltransferase family 2 protein [Nostoc sp. UHCC 0870]